MLVLGEDLLDDGNPWDLPVLNADCVGHTEGAEVQGVDAVSADGIVGVEENLLHAAWDFSEDGSTRDEPAVADKALTHVFVLDAAGTEERVISRVDS